MANTARTIDEIQLAKDSGLARLEKIVITVLGHVRVVAILDGVEVQTWDFNTSVAIRREEAVLAPFINGRRLRIRFEPLLGVSWHVRDHSVKVSPLIAGNTSTESTFSFISQPQYSKDKTAVQEFYSVDVTYTGAITVTPYIDGVAQTAKALTVATIESRQNFLIGGHGKSIYFKFTGTGAVYDFKVSTESMVCGHDEAEAFTFDTPVQDFGSPSRDKRVNAVYVDCISPTGLASDEFGSQTQQDLLVESKFGWGFLLNSNGNGSAIAHVANSNSTTPNNFTLETQIPTINGFLTGLLMPIPYRTVLGDFDVEIKFNHTETVAGTNIYAGMVVMDDTSTSFVTNSIAIVSHADIGTDNAIKYKNVVNSVGSNSYANLVNTTTMNKYLRVARVANTINLYYKENASDSWILAQSTVRNDFTSTTKVGFFCHGALNSFTQQLRATFDYFRAANAATPLTIELLADGGVVATKSIGSQFRTRVRLSGGGRAKGKLFNVRLTNSSGGESKVYSVKYDAKLTAGRRSN